MKKKALKVVLAVAVVVVAVLVSIGLTATKASVKNVGITVRPYHVPYALCAASSTTPTNEFMRINGYKYRVGLSVCPIETGRSLANIELTGGLKFPKGSNMVWSLFGTPAEFPQQQTDGTWLYQAMKVRNFKTSPTPGGGSSNQWSFPCVILPAKFTATNPSDGTTVVFKAALCRGPMMENINNKPIKYGSRVNTQAAEGLPNPIVAQLSTFK